jgi:hypothetical protein
VFFLPHSGFVQQGNLRLSVIFTKNSNIAANLVLLALCNKVNHRNSVSTFTYVNFKGNFMKKLLLATVITAAFLSGCSSVPMESIESSKAAQDFSQPSADSSVIYVYRKDAMAGASLKKDVLIDDECIGETATGVFFYQEVAGNKEHKISTESEFSANDLIINTESGKLYFVEQYIKMGLLVGGAGLKEIDKEVGMKEVLKLKLAKKGTCGA